MIYSISSITIDDIDFRELNNPIKPGCMKTKERIGIGALGMIQKATRISTQTNFITQNQC
ncbi:MAG: hypothetical protein B6D71_02340 [gamma proteobacterium symbiont of Stewartia floridana]|nr:MAG: hypothetical protein B6D71_02340 [gamma proteobacterium symbiont of Stewartia floridana]